MSPHAPKHGPADMGTSKNGASEFSTGFERIAQALAIGTQLELAALLNIRQSSISDAKRRGVIPGEWALKLYQLYRLNPRWIYDGLPPVYLARPDATGTPARPGPDASFLLKYAEGSLVAVRMADASMEPAIRKDAFIGINLHDKEIVPGKLLGVDLPFEGITVRRIQLDESSGMAVLSAENPAVPQQRVTKEQARAMVMGRVVWILALA